MEMPKYTIEPGTKVEEVHDDLNTNVQVSHNKPRRRDSSGVLPQPDLRPKLSPCSPPPPPPTKPGGDRLIERDADRTFENEMTRANLGPTTIRRVQVQRGDN